MRCPAWARWRDDPALLRQRLAINISARQFAQPDFGTGYSSLAYLTELPFDVIKIDQRFMARLQQHDRRDEAIVTAIIVLGRRLGMTVLAEGVETPEQAQYLLEHGCHQLQGYLYGRPMPIEAFEALVRARPGASHDGDNDSGTR